MNNREPRRARWARSGMIILSAAFAVTAAPVASQQRTTVTPWAGLAAPVGSFGAESGDEAGLADWGLTLGLDLGVPVGSGSLVWLSTLQGAVFPVDRGFLDDLVGPGVDAQVGRYVGGVILTGAQLVTSGSQTTASATAQLAVGAMRAPNATVTGAGADAELVASFEPLKGVAVGLGVSFADRYSFAVRYAHFVNPQISGEFRLSGQSPTSFTDDQAMSWVSIVLGVTVG